MEVKGNMDKQPSWVDAYYSKHEQFDKINQAIMDAQFPEVRNIYVDLNCLKNTHLGALYNFAPSQEVRKYLISHLEDFNKRLKRDFTSAYPDYPIGELEMKMKYMDTVNSESIFNFSPDTDFCINIYDYLTTIMSQNARAGYGGKVAVHINTYPLEITPFMKRWVAALGQYIASHDFQLVRSSHAEMRASYWSNFQVIILDDLVPCVQESSGIYDPLFRQGMMRGTEIFAPFQIEDKIYNKLQEDGFSFENHEAIDDMFDFTALMMSICCNFHYMHFTIPQPRG